MTRLRIPLLIAVWVGAWWLASVATEWWMRAPPRY
jgi:hypothetical protein